MNGTIPPPPAPRPLPTVPAFEFDPSPTIGLEPLLAPGSTAVTPTPGAADWMRAPNCPNNATDCRITVSMLAVSTPVPPPIHSGDGASQPPLVLQAKPHGDCTVCNLSWDITRGPLGPNEIPVTPVAPPVFPPVTRPPVP